ncbi:Ger(x)C family spore germination protein [Domibacillus aminovorans]|uniref:Uncharacterized protein n=1 Tax=Domibacillus aminovorans TaxID=29332 RepID=A0A177LEY3_9BACI|nr:Ger(x)C family spore germination protein [Domibacillus aminovorans]OAH63111.1 hypothetical protein AWH49_07155 [Domibacillus aminovorans]
MKKWIGLGLSCLLLAGCWDERQLKERSIIFGAAIDAPSKEEIAFTVAIPEPGNEQKPASTKQVISATGRTVRESTRKIDRKASAVVEIGKMRVLLISKESIQHDIYPLLDDLYRNARSPLNAKIIITEGKAEPFFRNEIEGEPLYSTYYHTLIESAEDSTMVPNTNLQRFASPLFDKSDGEAAMAPLITFNKEEKMAEVKGTALFNDRRIAGELSVAETTVLLLMNDEKGKDATLTFPMGKEENMTIRIEKMKRKMKLHMPKDGPASVDLSYQLSYRVTDYPPGHLEEQKVVKKVNKKISDEIKQSMDKTMDKIKEAESDILGIGLSMSAKDPDRFKQLKWENAYPELNVKIHVKAEIIESGITF